MKPMSLPPICSDTILGRRGERVELRRVGARRRCSAARSCASVRAPLQETSVSDWPTLAAASAGVVACSSAGSRAASATGSGSAGPRRTSPRGRPIGGAGRRRARRQGRAATRRRPRPSAWCALDYLLLRWTPTDMRTHDAARSLRPGAAAAVGWRGGCSRRGLDLRLGVRLGRDLVLGLPDEPVEDALGDARTGSPRRGSRPTARSGRCSSGSSCARSMTLKRCSDCSSSRPAQADSAPDTGERKSTDHESP